MIGEDLPPITEYQKYFLHYKSQRYIMEAGPGYLYGGEELARIFKETLGEIRLIFILRNPVDKLYSDFKWKSKTLVIENIAFDEFVQLAIEQSRISDLSMEKLIDNPIATALDGGLYAKYLHQWYNLFHEDLIKVVFFDDLKKNPADLLKSVCNWLDIDTHLHTPHDFTIENRGFYYRKRSIHKIAMALNELLEPFFRTYPAVKRTIRKLYIFNTKENPSVLDDMNRKKLEHFYAPHNENLFTLLKSKGHQNSMPGWLSSPSIVNKH